MDIIPQIRDAMHTLLTTTTEAIAAAQHSVKHPDRAKFPPSTLDQTLVYGWLAQPTATVEQLAEMACRIGVDGSPQWLLAASSWHDPERSLFKPIQLVAPAARDLGACGV